jgi:spore germination cell wall hydrolase CwlJ-like protein
MTSADLVLLALTCWRENRGGGYVGMQSVANVVMNRVARRGTDAYTECTRPLQFSSITARGDAQLNLWPNEADDQWLQAKSIAGLAAAAALPDLTGGATDYYAPAGLGPQRLGKTFTLPNGASVAFPDGWDPDAVAFTGEIAGQLFFR